MDSETGAATLETKRVVSGELGQPKWWREAAFDNKSQGDVQQRVTELAGPALPDALHRLTPVILSGFCVPLRRSCDMANSSNRLEGKVAIITGGASGIGEASVRLFVDNGARVIIADVQVEKGTSLASELGKHVAIFKHCDVTLETDVEALVAFAIEQWGKLDIMFNNAGILGKTVVEDVQGLNMQDLRRVLEVNVHGMALGMKYASRAMVDKGTKGVILCTASVASVLGGLAPIPYTVSKHAILGLVRAASSDLGKHGIRVNCISPSGVVTPLLMDYFHDGFGDPNYTPKQAQNFVDTHANLTGHSLSPMDIARAALYLASEDGAFVSGLNLIIDGGFSASNHSLNS
ncbi:hypothetical protein GOP47_0007172 [Adiantum capillus-veneris]|uniref:Uncharacterized protein n=1 Tax=Adiantum capillus-veneris TaxID=13818 RepID=A0A9D4ZIZ3_ADICA|nr:hypothetical protein GOP47_0007172 [Adiantum capillus-veneris]